jgi:nicotinamidase-related amidase
VTSLPDLQHAIHVVIDMQDLFDRHPEWGFPALRSVLPQVTALARHDPAATFWTRFIPAANAAAAPGSWGDYYRLWPTATLAAGADKFIDLLPELKAIAAAENIFDKPAFSAFTARGFAEALKRRAATTLILSGAETDVCVWATALDAIDLGYHVVLARDAMASFSGEAHAAILTTIAPRFIPQIAVSDTATLLQQWH